MNMIRIPFQAQVQNLPPFFRPPPHVMHRAAPQPAFGDARSRLIGRMRGAMGRAMGQYGAPGGGMVPWGPSCNPYSGLPSPHSNSMLANCMPTGQGFPSWRGWDPMCTMNVGSECGPIHGFPVGFLFNNVAANGQGVTVVTPQVRFRIERILFDPNEAQNFVLNSVVIGNKLQNIGGPDAGTLCSFYVPDAENNLVQFDEAGPGINVTVTVTNLDAANAHTLRGSFFGPAIG